jgi:hydrogenase-4 component B
VILMGVGAGMVGVAAGSELLAVLGFLAALYHLLNHAFFKSLLFLNAGALISQAHTQDLNRMGGLARRMPFTALTFLIAALSVAAIPPLNGFVSEWFTYQAFFAGGQAGPFTARALLPLCAAALALAGAFTLMVYLKAYGGAFAGPARNPAVETAQEAPASMRFSAGYLALGCFALGVGAPWVAPLLAHIAAGLAGFPVLETTNAWQVFPGDPGRGVLSPLLIALLLLGLLIVPPVLIAAYGGRRAGRRGGVEPWSCGYGYAPHMSVSAGSFDQPARAAYLPLYQARRLFDRPLQAIQAASAVALRWIRKTEPVIETAVSRPTVRLVETAGRWVQALQMGDIRVYCFYIILTLAILLLVSFGRSGL